MLDARALHVAADIFYDERELKVNRSSGAKQDDATGKSQTFGRIWRYRHVKCKGFAAVGGGSWAATIAGRGNLIGVVYLC